MGQPCTLGSVGGVQPKILLALGKLQPAENMKIKNFFGATCMKMSIFKIKLSAFTLNCCVEPQVVCSQKIKCTTLCQQVHCVFLSFSSFHIEDFPCVKPVILLVC